MLDVFALPIKPSMTYIHKKLATCNKLAKPKPVHYSVEKVNINI